MTSERNDLWTRLAALDHCCTVNLESAYSGVGSVMRWRVVVTRKDGSAPPVVVEGANARETIMRAIEQAEGFGWHGNRIS